VRIKERANYKRWINIPRLSEVKRRRVSRYQKERGVFGVFVGTPEAFSRVLCTPSGEKQLNSRCSPLRVADLVPFRAKKKLGHLLVVERRKGGNYQSVKSLGNPFLLDLIVKACELSSSQLEKKSQCRKREKYFERLFVMKLLVKKRKEEELKS
jgi:hypothetical protein